MNRDIRLATKAQADAVRAYLNTLGFELSHVQALEVIARGQGMRSRHALAAKQNQSGSQWVDANVRGNPALVQAMKNHAEAADGGARVPALAQRRSYTRVSYGYIDGSNCKRFSSMVFRGRLTRGQLRLIANRLDEGLYFVPCQVGFESLHLAFTDEGGDDHFWHKLELGDEEHWVFDQDGYVAQAGDVEQITDAEAGDNATDADCDNLMWRFARVLRWDDELQRAAVTANAYRTPEAFSEDVDDEQVARLAARWHGLSELRNVPMSLLEDLASMLMEAGFCPFPTVDAEVRRPVGPNAYQFCILQAVDPEHGDIAVNFEVTTQSGQYLTETPVMALSKDTSLDQLGQLGRQLADQLRAARAMPETYDARLE